MYGLTIKLVLILVAIITILMTGNANASTLVDPLNDWSLTTGHSQQLAFDNTNVDYFYGDHSRVKCNSGDSSTFYYHVAGARSFIAYSFFWDNLGGVKAYSSIDGATWTEVSVTSDAPQLTDATSTDWRYCQIRPSASLPPGTNYVAFTLQPDQSNLFTPQIGQVSITYGDEPVVDVSVPGPGGLMVAASAGSAHLDWFPVKDALSYTIERRTAAGKDYRTLASGIDDTSYVDSGLKQGVKYYYVVKARTPNGMTGPSEEVLASSTTEEGVFVDPLEDWSLAVKHSDDLAFGPLFGGAQTLRRTAKSDEFVEYKLSGATSFTVNVYSLESDPSQEIVADVSGDDVNWNSVRVTFKHTAGIGDNWYGSVCTPVDRLPAGSNYIRFRLTSTAAADSPQLAQVRLTSMSEVAGVDR